MLLLSTKSAGSSAVQKYLADRFEIRLLPHTPHHENETLFWTKAASALGLPQDRMHRSVVPYSQNEARNSLQKLLLKNNVDSPFRQWTEAEIFGAWFALTKKFGPAFFEKSPHHLRNRSNLELIARCMSNQHEQIDFLLIGLIRHPLDTIYSVWRRWGFDCRAFEKEWVASYENLIWAKSLFFEKLTLLRYEDIVRQPQLLDHLVKSAGLPPKEIPANGFSFHEHSIHSYLNDKRFVYQLAPTTILLAQRLGYQDIQQPKTGFFSRFGFDMQTKVRNLRYNLGKVKRIIFKEARL